MGGAHTTLTRADRAEELERFATRVRSRTLRAALNGSTVALGPALAAGDVFTGLLFSFLRHTPAFPPWAGRDRVILADPDLLPGWRAALAEAGYEPEPGEELPSADPTPTIDPLSYGVGHAIGLDLDESDARVVVVLRSGDLRRGGTWEGATLARTWARTQIIVVCLAEEEENPPLEGFETRTVAGHDWEELLEALEWAEGTDVPLRAIVARVEPGRGVPELKGGGRATREALEKATHDLERRALED